VVNDLWREAHALGEDTVDAVLSLDQSCLVIQGPPGAGKSYTGARIIAALIAKGQRVGIASNSYAAIGNLLSRVRSRCVRTAAHGRSRSMTFGSSHPKTHSLLASWKRSARERAWGAWIAFKGRGRRSCSWVSVRVTQARLLVARVSCSIEIA